MCQVLERLVYSIKGGCYYNIVVVVTFAAANQLDDVSEAPAAAEVCENHEEQKHTYEQLELFSTF